MGIKDVLIRYFADITRLLNIWFQKLHEINSRGCLSLSCKGLSIYGQYAENASTLIFGLFRSKFIGKKREKSYFLFSYKNQ
jgi:hypothetical protein